MTLLCDSRTGTLAALGNSLRCAIGRGGAIDVAAKREGDGATPMGRWPLRSALLRPDRIATPATALPWRWLRPADGWSDDGRDPAYNRPVSHPHRFSAEHLWRDDGVYDVIVVLGHNDRPPLPGGGSAIFLHCSRTDWRPTEGCIAIETAALVALLPRLQAGMMLEIV